MDHAPSAQAPVTDPAALAAALIRCPSVTPQDAGAQTLIADWLAGQGFEVHRLRFNEVENLYASLGHAPPFLCLAGHTDVVPPGDAVWRLPPFAGRVENGTLYGRGACDMKGGLAALIAAAARVLAEAPVAGKLAFLITGDEEGPARDGTARVLDWMRERGEIPDFCLLAEPTNPERLGEVIKIGRRGSLNAQLTVRGVQGHAAYPHRADNPIHRLVRILTALTAAPLDAGTSRFEPSSLQITSIDVGNPATNVIPSQARAAFNIRFNDQHTGATLSAWLRQACAAHAPDHTLDIAVSGGAFLTEPGPALDHLQAAIEAESGARAALDTGGGTSDARFIATLCPVAEFGPVGASMHKADEHIRLDELETLTRIYTRFLRGFFAAPRS